MAESMPQKIFTAKPNGEIEYFNRQWAEFTGLARSSRSRAWGWTQLIHPDDLDANVKAWRHSLETGEPFHFEHRFRRADGKYRWHLTRAQRDARRTTGEFPCGSDPAPIFTNKRKKRRSCGGPMTTCSNSPIPPVTICRNRSGMSRYTARSSRSGTVTSLDAEGQQFLGFLTGRRTPSGHADERPAGVYAGGHGGAERRAGGFRGGSAERACQPGGSDAGERRRRDARRSARKCSWAKPTCNRYFRI